MARRIFNIPILLIIPICLLLIVIVAGAYRFSLDEDKMMDKFAAASSMDPVVHSLFDVTLPGVLVLPVPEITANTVFSDFDAERSVATGQYDSGAERGTVTLYKTPQLEFDFKLGKGFVVLASVSNQGSGHFYYLVSFGLDSQRTRLVALDNYFLGDRVKMTAMDNEVGHISIKFLTHAIEQAMAEEPQQKMEKQLVVDDLGRFSEK
ncbi:hypothetical protein RCJ22_17550 [Vibrio sp. FNV 38]|nr:hypothetical protein [Vibrio sp. FNV 38]